MSPSPALVQVQETRIKEYHILATQNNQPSLMRVRASNGRDALTYASRRATNLVLLFVTK